VRPRNVAHHQAAADAVAESEEEEIKCVKGGSKAKGRARAMTNTRESKMSDI
jgi:hypothetical protein